MRKTLLRKLFRVLARLEGAVQRHAVQESLKRRMAMTLHAWGVATLVVWVYACTYFDGSLAEVGWFQLGVWALVIAPVPIWLSQGGTAAGRVLLVVGAVLEAVSPAFFTKNTGFYFYLFPCMFLPFLLFGVRERAGMFIGALMPLLAWLGAEVFQGRVIPGMGGGALPLDVQTYWLDVIGSLLACGVLLYSMSRISDRFEREALDSSRLTMISTIVGGLAHEVSSPLGVIQLASENIRRQVKAGTPFTPADLSQFGVITDAARRIAKILQVLRGFTRRDLTGHREKTEVRQLLVDAFLMLAVRFSDLKVELDMNRVPDALTIECRPEQMQQVFYTLLNNAADAIQESRAAGEQSWIRVEAEDSPDQLTILFSDSGPGMSPETERRLFEPFFTTKHPGRGLGLGLGTARGIVESHGGTLSLVPGARNTTFRIQFQKRVLG